MLIVVDRLLVSSHKVWLTQSNAGDKQMISSLAYILQRTSYPP